MDPRPRAYRLSRPVAALALCCAAVTGPALASGPAQAARPAPTCQGHQATIVGSPQQGGSVTGTDGDDVIVTNGDYGIDGGAGDDIICITADRGDTGGDIDDGVYVDAGPGDDQVSIPADQFGEYAYRTDVNLGAGADTFTSAGGRVTVDGAAYDVDDSERDQISSTGGYLDVTVGDGGVVADSISLGGRGGFVTLKADRMAPGAVIETSAPDSGISFGSRTAGTWVIDNPAGRVSRDGEQQFRIDGFANLTWTSPQPVGFVGGPQSESLVADTVSVADLGGGDDQLETSLAGATDLGADRRFAGGDGTDTVSILRLDTSDTVGRIEVQHVADTTSMASLDGAEGFPVVDFEEYRLYGSTAVSFTGGDQADRVTAFACGGATTVRGGGGDDRLVTSLDYDSFSRYFSCNAKESTTEVYGEDGDDRIFGGVEQQATIFGGRGDDDVSGGRGVTTMKGGTGDDVLDGGGGKDSANGSGGRDFCRAEKRTQCER